MKTVSVIIPVYNRTFSIRDAVESVLIQSVKPSEIIVIDDGSSFDMVLYLKNYMQHIRLIKLGNYFKSFGSCKKHWHKSCM